MCTHPIRAWKPKRGKRLVFSVSLGQRGTEKNIPCGQCMECRIKRERDWAARIMCEVQTTMEKNKKSYFLSLTYNDYNLPFVNKNGKTLNLPTLKKSDPTLFIKRLRKSQESKKNRFRYYLSGEYGEKTKRPHYHMAIFGIEFPDAYCIGKSSSGYDIYGSDYLDDMWWYGNTTIQNLDFGSAEYISKHFTKIITGEKAENYYQGRLPEYSTQSRRPYGIGAEWIDKYYTDVFPRDKLSVNPDLKIDPPRYFTDRIRKQEKRKKSDPMKSGSLKLVEQLFDLTEIEKMIKRRGEEKIYNKKCRRSSDDMARTEQYLRRKNKNYRRNQNGKAETI